MKKEPIVTPGYKPKTLSTAIAAGILTLTSDAFATPVIEEMVVTATRRAESTIDIPYNVTVVGGDTIRNAGILDLNELVRFVPGLVTADLGADARSITV